MCKLIIGIDMAKDSFHVCVKSELENGDVKIIGSRKFKNQSSEYQKLLTWVSKRIKPFHDSPIFVMEATGVYHENLAYFLYEKGQSVSIVLPNKLKYFTKSFNIVTKTDKLDASIIAQYGIERKMKLWKPVSPVYLQLKILNRKKLSLKKQRTRSKNQLHALTHAHQSPESAIAITKKQIAFYEKSIHELDQEIAALIKQDPVLDEKIDKAATIKGVGRQTVIALICETNGFELFQNIRQLVSYAGLDIVLNESGKFKGKTRISKKGNNRIRSCLYMPALVAKQHNAKLKDLNDRIVLKNPDIKQKGTVACMRKLLILVYTLWKKDEVYDEKYELNITK